MAEASIDVVVVGRVDEADGVVALILESADRAPLPEWTPGAHVDIHVPGDKVRQYSLSSRPEVTNQWRLGVLREIDGRGGSAWIHDRVVVGTALRVSAPRNNFALHEAARYRFIAGGIGITPIVSMVRHVRSAGGPRFSLYYLTRSPEETTFGDELAAAGAGSRSVIHHDGGDPERAFDLWPLFERPRPVHVYACGPRGLLQAIRDMTGHWSATSIHVESFADAGTLAVADDRPFRVRLARSGEVVDVGAKQSILDALRAHGLEVPSSCESGTCGTCRTRLVAGEADHRDLVLTDAEHADTIMVCVSRARSPEIVIDR